MSNPATGRADGPAIVMYDDAVARQFEPFALTRPICTLMTGTSVVTDRWRNALQRNCAGSVSAPHLADFDEAPGIASGDLPEGTIVANSRFAPALEVVDWNEAGGTRDGRPGATSAERSASPGGLASTAGSWTNGGRVVAVRLTRSVPAGQLSDGSVPLDTLADPSLPSVQMNGWWHDEVWDYLRHLREIIADDIVRAAAIDEMMGLPEEIWAVPDHVTVLGSHPVRVMQMRDAAATIEPHVVIDATAGPVMIVAGAHVHSFTRITGPCFIGPNATIMGGDITGCAIGPVAKIRGEISGSIVLGYSNKGHEGFVGNSYLGRWVNLGAGTTTSNLKNTYGPVALWTPTGVRATGMQFLGTLFGDHVKTGIGTMLTTGTVLGAGANVFGSVMPPKAVAPFSWGEGEPYDLYRIDKFLASTEIVMGRRKVVLTDKMKRQLTASFDARWAVEPTSKGSM